MSLRPSIVWSTVVAAALVTGWVSIVYSGADYPWNLYVGHFPDIAADKYTALAAVDGSGPYVSLAELAQRYGFADSGWVAPGPRPPGALIWSVPLILIPDRWLLLVMVPVMVAWVGSLMWATTRIGGIDTRWGAVGVLLWIASPLYSWDVLYGSMTFVTIWGVVVAWWLLPRRTLLAGGILGLAAAVKLWPAIVIAALLLRRDTRRSGLIAVVAATTISLAGLLLPGASIGGSIDALGQAGSHFGNSRGNLSSVQAFGWPAVAVAAAIFGIAISRDRVDWRIGGAVVAGLMLSPIVWSNYLLTALPLVVLGSKSIIAGLFEQKLSNATVGTDDSMEKPALGDRRN